MKTRRTAPRIARLARRRLPFGYGDWQLAGRSSAGPVHCPLWPAPLPPFVGGLGLAHAGVTPTKRAPQASTTMVNLLIYMLPFSRWVCRVRGEVRQTLDDCGGLRARGRPERSRPSTTEHRS